jgi:hypothetical protein
MKKNKHKLLRKLTLRRILLAPFEIICLILLWGTVLVGVTMMKLIELILGDEE